MRAPWPSRLVLPVLILLFLAACGGTPATRGAPATPSGSVAGGRGGGGTRPPAGTAPRAAGGATWQGGTAWAALTKLGNYAYQATTTTSDGGQGVAVTVQGRYHSPTDYELTIRQGAQHAVRLILASNGHRYLAQAGQAPLDLGAGSGKSPYAAMFDVYEMQATGPWIGLFTGSHGTYSGPCSVLGRTGSAFHVGAATPGAVGALTGVSERVAGITCIDARTKAPLKAGFSWSMGVGSQAITYSDRFEVTAVGTVPEIPAPSGAKPFPGAPGG